MKQYVVGFLWIGDSVVLIRKNRPEWQAGKWNGVGGKVEPGETAEEAMVREFEEETGFYNAQWFPFCVNTGPDYQVRFFVSRVVLEEMQDTIESATDEPVECVHMKCFNLYPMIPNLCWLLPMSLFALERQAAGDAFKADITEHWNSIPPES